MATVIVGGFFGDEGKGKIISYLALKDDVDIAVRGGVGPNAGHTTVYKGVKSKLRMLPSAFVNKRTKLMIGAGVIVNPKVLVDEIKRFNVENRFMIDPNCCIIEEKHINEDRGGHLKDKIGTTGTGTGPANSDRVLRKAKVVRDLPELQKYIGDVAFEVNKALDEGKLVLLEGTQGTYLSLFHGTYPFVTSKDVTASAICSDAGIGPKKVKDVVVVFKAYVTRVGAGPLEGELSKEEAKRRGWLEFGTVTGRQRRVAPFNFELAKRAVMLNSATQIALTKLDVLYPECKDVKDFEMLSDRAKKFIKRIEEELRVPVTLIGTGEETISVIDRRSELL